MRPRHHAAPMLAHMRMKESSTRAEFRPPPHTIEGVKHKRRPSSRVLRSDHRNRLKPPFKLRERGTSTVSDSACKGRQGSRLPAAQHCGRSPAPSTSRPPIRRSRPPGLRVRSTHRCVTPTVDRPPRAMPGKRVPAAAGTRRELEDPRATSASGATRAPQRPLITSSFPSLRISHDVPSCSRPRVGGRWIYYPSLPTAKTS
jgi:hypothetical protein